MHVLNYAHLPTYIKKSIKIRQMEKKSQNLSNGKKAGHASSPSIWEDYEFKASLGYETLYQKISKKKKRKTTFGGGGRQSIEKI